MDFKFHNMDENRIKESILKKKNYSFVIGYDLMVHDCVTAEIAARQRITAKSSHS